MRRFSSLVLLTLYLYPIACGDKETLHPEAVDRVKEFKEFGRRLFRGCDVCVAVPWQAGGGTVIHLLQAIYKVRDQLFGLK